MMAARKKTEKAVTKEVTLKGTAKKTEDMIVCTGTIHFDGPVYLYEGCRCVTAVLQVPSADLKTLGVPMLCRVVHLPRKLQGGWELMPQMKQRRIQADEIWIRDAFKACGIDASTCAYHLLEGKKVSCQINWKKTLNPPPCPNKAWVGDVIEAEEITHEA